MKFQLTINALACSALFGMWQANFTAGAFMFVLLGTVYSCIDYFKLK